MKLFLYRALCLVGIGFSYASPTPPSQDPFYRLPPEYQRKQPGEIINYRSLPYPLKSPLPSFIDRGYQLVYRSTDSFHRPTASLATLLVPPNANFSRIFVYFPIQNSACIDCSPSYTLVEGVKAKGSSEKGIEFVHILSISGALNQGWIVIMPDYEGFNAAFLANQRGAFAGLDSIRAAIASSSFSGISDDAVAVLMGYSGASPSAVLAAELHGNYAPELQIEGLATGGLLIDLETVLKEAIPSPNNIPAALWGLANEYPAMESIVQGHLTSNDPKKKAEFERARYECAGELKQNFGKANISAYFDGLDWMNSSTVNGILRENRLGQDKPDIPLLVYESDRDDKSPNWETDAFIQSYCEEGVLVDYRKYSIESHVLLAVDGVFGALTWAKERFDGVSVGKKCKKSHHVTALWPNFPVFVSEALVGFVDRHLGTELSLI